MSIALPKTKDLILEHYSRKPITGIMSYPYNQSLRDKPNGFWVSVKGDCDWPWFVKNELSSEDRLGNKVTVELKEDANILLLESVEAVLAFSEEFSLQPQWAKEFPSGQGYFHIDWDRVADLYDGIIITPYQWPLRNDGRTSWYYGWDVASGCIWNVEKLVIKPNN
jgi:hypothetical protein